MARKHKNYTEDEVLRSVLKKQAIQQPKTGGHITPGVLHIHVSAPGYKGDIGNGTKGKLDFLRKYCGYSISWI